MVEKNAYEDKRIVLQAQLDAAKTQGERNRLGQFATPTELAMDILAYAKKLLPAGISVRFLDPAFGTGSFFSALLRTFPVERIAAARGFEVDPHYGKPAMELWGSALLRLHLADFTCAGLPTTEAERSNLIICNPPYVRHHHISSDEKTRLKQLAAWQTQYRLSGLAGLYCYFLLLSPSWMSPNGLAGWLIPSEFLEVKYGHQVKQFLLKNVTLLHIHRFDPQQTQFEDALVSSVVVWFRNTPPKPNHQVRFSFGGTLTTPEKSVIRSAATLDSSMKWTWHHIKSSQNKVYKSSDRQEVRLANLFSIKRGLATGANKFFVLTAEQIADLKLPQACIRPILPSPRYLACEEIEADQLGHPKIEKQLFLLDSKLPETVIKEKYPSVWAYLQTGIEQGIHKRYLCQHRSPWYAQENRLPAPILCTYMGRVSQTQDSPFRFILNHSIATAPNVYLLLYPKPALAMRLKNDSQLLRSMWQALQQITATDLISEGRVYGGGLHKLEPNELANAKIRTKNILELAELRDGVQLSLL